MHYVYLLFNTNTSRFYVGETSNLKRRLLEHQNGENISTKYEASHWKIVYVEFYRLKTDALIREKKLKSHGSGMVEIKKRIVNSLKLIKPKTGEGQR